MLTKQTESNSRTRPGPATLTDSSPNLDAMCCCGPLSSPERPQLGPRMLLYFSTAAVGGNETELLQPIAGTCLLLLLLLEATPPVSDRRKRLNFLKLSFTAIDSIFRNH